MFGIKRLKVICMYACHDTGKIVQNSFYFTMKWASAHYLNLGRLIVLLKHSFYSIMLSFNKSHITF